MIFLLLGAIIVTIRRLWPYLRHPHASDQRPDLHTAGALLRGTLSAVPDCIFREAARLGKSQDHPHSFEEVPVERKAGLAVVLATRLPVSPARPGRR